MCGKQEEYPCATRTDIWALGNEGDNMRQGQTYLTVDKKSNSMRRGQLYTRRVIAYDKDRHIRTVDKESDSVQGQQYKLVPSLTATLR